MNFDDAVHNAVEDFIRRFNELLEQRCEEALQGGVCGVMIVHYPSGAATIGVDSKVPYGMVHEYWYPNEPPPS